MDKDFLREQRRLVTECKKITKALSNDRGLEEVEDTIKEESNDVEKLLKAQNKILYKAFDIVIQQLKVMRKLQERQTNATENLLRLQKRGDIKGQVYLGGPLGN